MTTLYQALNVHYLNNPQFESPDEFTEPYRTLLHGHDLVHLVYGVDTTLWGENCAELITMLKTDYGFWEYLGFWRTPQGRETVQRFVKLLGVGRMFLALTYIPFATVYVLWRFRNQKGVFPFYEYIGNTQITLEEVREKYNITPVKPEKYRERLFTAS